MSDPMFFVINKINSFVESSLGVFTEYLLFIFKGIDEIIVIDQNGFFASVLGVLRCQIKFRMVFALALVIRIVWRLSVARITNGVLFGRACMCLVQSGTAPRANPAGLTAMVRAVRALVTFPTYGITSPGAVLRYAITWAASAAMWAHSMMTRVWMAPTHL